MVPAVFVLLDALPLSRNGKVDRGALPAPSPATDTAAGYVPPRTGTEQTLATIWADVLGVDQVGIHDNFFELGGDSILSIQVVSRARHEGLALMPRRTSSGTRPSPHWRRMRPGELRPWRWLIRGRSAGMCR